MNISICNACRSVDANGSIRLFDMSEAKSLVLREYPDANVSIRRTENDDDEEYIVAAIFGRIVTSDDEAALRAIEVSVGKIIDAYRDSLKS